jgi:hypothetical protein
MLVAHRAPAQTPLHPLPQDFSEFGLIGVDVYQVRAPNGRLLVVRGKLQNPYDTKVAGVRLVIRLLSPGVQPRELDRVEKDLNVAIEPGREIMFNRDVDTAYAYVFYQMTVAAFAKRRGTTELPAPSLELEKQVSTGRAAPLFTWNVPIVSPLGPIGAIPSGR